MMLSRSFAVTFLFLSSCGPGKATVELTVGAAPGVSVDCIASIAVTTTLTAIDKMSLATTFPWTMPITSTAPALLALKLDKDHTGDFLLSVVALDVTGTVLATATATGHVIPSGTATLPLTFTSAILGACARDMAVAPDLATRDMTVLADLAMPDLVAPPDLATPPDLTIPPDLVATCGNGILDEMETDLDCGGPHCGGCADTKKCIADKDCANAWCNSGVCATPTCMDKVKNGLETDVDCGGPKCSTCADGKMCKLGTDCVNQGCDPMKQTCLPANYSVAGFTTGLGASVVGMKNGYSIDGQLRMPGPTATGAKNGYTVEALIPAP